MCQAAILLSFLFMYRAIGYPGPPSEAVHYALAYLDHLLVMRKVVARDSTAESAATTMFITPRLELPDVFELFHHTNQVVSGFVKDCFVG